ncbi:MAG: type II toxin-antitoxin system RelE/ParE family toxin [Gammaproteobacteria bacterium]|nr:type II toxin-antitoxin system RelE/ParE family toxin [Gammaproteobacteria bacterium]
MIELRKYRDIEGKIPFDEWLYRLKDSRAKTRILTRLNRLKAGNEGDWKSVGEDVRELRIPEGKGYRVYYAWDGDTVVLLLCGGDKSSQKQDIATAKDYWRNCRDR